MKNKQKELLKNELFQKWVNSEDEEINNYWEKWMLNHPDQAEDLRRNRELIKALKFHEYKVAPEEVSKSWQQVAMAAPSEQKARWINILLKTAAVLVFLSTVAFVITYLANSNTSPEKVAHVNYIEKQAERGIKLTVQLPDGSKIKLNSGSKLIYPEVFASNKREVQLIGEGYFEVMRDENRPFSITTDDIVTTVLGTKFAINAFSEDNIKVSLVSGSVKVDSYAEGNDAPTNSLTLTPGDKAVFLNNQLTKGVVDELVDVGWKDDIMVFKNNDIDEIAAKLGNWYGVDFEISNKDKITKSFNGIYEKEVLENVLKSMAHALGFTYEINGNRVLITGK